MRPNKPVNRRLVSNSDSFKRKRRVRNKKITLFLVIIFLFLLGAFIAVTRFDRLRIQTVTVSGNEVLPPEDIENFVSQNIAGYYFWIFPKNSILLYPKQRIERELTETYSRIATVDLDRQRVRELHIEVVEYKGTYLWCGFEYDREAQCYFVDKNGLVFNEAPVYSGTLFFKFFGSPLLETESDVIGKPIFKADEFSVILDFKQVLSDLRLRPFAFYSSDKEYIYYIETSGTRPLRILLEPHVPLEKLAENLESALLTQPLKDLYDTGLSTVDYIDLRFDNKVLYKTFDGDSTKEEISE